MSLHHAEIGPRAQFAGIVMRTDRRIDLQIWNDPDATAYRVWASVNPNNLYGNPVGSGVGGSTAGRVMLFEVQKGQMFRSPTIRRRGWGTTGENLGKTTRAIFDLSDFTIPNNPVQLPSPNGQFYLSVQQVRAGVPSVVVGVAAGTVQISGVAAPDAITIKGILFTAINGAANPALQQYEDVAFSGGDIATATSLALAINDPASQALISAAATVGVVCTATPQGDTVVLVASTPGITGAFTLVESTAGARIILSGIAMALPPNAGEIIQGPMLIVPPVESFGMLESTLIAVGVAPDLAPAAGTTPRDFDATLVVTGPPMAFVLPRPTTSVTVRNTDNANGLWVSFGWSQPYLPLSSAGLGDAEITTFGSVKEIFVSGNLGSPTFAIIANLGLGAPGGA